MTPGIVGKPTPLRTEAATGDERPVRAPRHRLAGGSVPSETHWSSATSSARRPGFGNERVPGLLADARPARPIPRYAAGSRTGRTGRSRGSWRSFPSVSVCKSDPALTQYSFAEFASKILGQVPLARQRRRTAVGLPRDRIEEHLVREGELALGIPAPDVLAVGSAGLGEPIVEEASAAPADPVEHRRRRRGRPARLR